jgi:predicted nucleotidyltransferase
MRAFVNQDKDRAKAIPPDMDERLRSVLPELLQGRPVALAYLYGSAARGQTTPFSDVDVALVLNQSLSREEQFRLELSLQAEIEEACSLPEADVRVIDQAPLTVQGLVVTQGQLLYCRQESQRIQFETMVRQRYFDYQPVARHMQRLFFERIRREGLRHGG